MKYQNIRENLSGGFDADIEHPQYGLIPYTIPDDEELVLTENGAEILDDEGNPTGEFEQVETFRGNAIQHLKAEETAGRVVIAWKSAEEKQADADVKAIEAERQWVQAELDAADIEIRKLEDGHSRAVADIPRWRFHRNALRNRIVDGVIQGDRPVRPV